MVMYIHVHVHVDPLLPAAVCYIHVHTYTALTVSAQLMADRLATHIIIYFELAPHQNMSCTYTCIYTSMYMYALCIYMYTYIYMYMYIHYYNSMLYLKLLDILLTSKILACLYCTSLIVTFNNFIIIFPPKIL